MITITLLIVFYILGFHLAWDHYHAEAEEHGLEIVDRVDKVAMVVTCLLWPAVELRSLLSRGE